MSRVEFERPDGKVTPGWRESADGDVGIVLIQEWWGVNDQMKSVAARLAGEGYATLVPDLYRGRLAASADEANHMMNQLDWADATHQDLAGAVAHVRERHRRVVVMGFCMGGALTIAACAHAAPDAGVCFYGIPERGLAEPAQIRTPLLAHFATRDDWCTPAAVAAFETELEGAKVDFELHRYEADHAFFNQARPEVYDEDASQLAWTRTLDFIRRKVG